MRAIARLAQLLALCFCLSAPPALAQVTMGSLIVDPMSVVRPDLLQHALAALAAHPKARRDTIAVVDFSKPSLQERFYIVDLKTGSVEAYRTAHGKGSDSGAGMIPTRFSNIANSEASSLGAYLTLQRYTGKHGLSLALDGLEQTNSNARDRAIVLHSAPYMDDAFVKAHGRPGRSWGCFVVDPKVLDHVVAALQGGALIYAGQ